MRKVLCTAATGEAHEWGEISRPSFAAYAARHGYEFVCVEERLDQSRPASWDKVLLCRRELERADLVVWVDADCVIVDLEEDIAGQLPDEAFMAVRENDTTRGLVPNTGVLVFRAGELAESFLDATWARSDRADHIWWENAAMMDVWGFRHRVTDDLRVVDCALDVPTDFYAHTAQLDVRFNSMFFAGCDEPVIRHLAGVYPRSIRADLLRLDTDLFSRRYHRDGHRRAGPRPAGYDWTAAYARAQSVGEDAEQARLAWRLDASV
jgi:hypothetical protein